jgi:hypothetical protein
LGGEQQVRRYVHYGGIAPKGCYEIGPVRCGSFEQDWFEASIAPDSCAARYFPGAADQPGQFQTGRKLRLQH